MQKQFQGQAWDRKIDAPRHLWVGCDCHGFTEAGTTHHNILQTYHSAETGFDSSRYLENVTHMCTIPGMRTETEGLQHYISSITAKFVQVFGVSLPRFHRGYYAGLPRVSLRLLVLRCDCHGFTEASTIHHNILQTYHITYS